MFVNTAQSNCLQWEPTETVTIPLDPLLTAGHIPAPASALTARYFISDSDYNDDDYDDDDDEEEYEDDDDNYCDDNDDYDDNDDDDNDEYYDNE